MCWWLVAYLEIVLRYTYFISKPAEPALDSPLITQSLNVVQFTPFIILNFIFIVKLPAPVCLNIYFHLCLSSLFSLWLHVISKILNCNERTEDRQPTHSMWPLACHNVTWHGMDFKIWCLVKLYYGDKTLGLVRWRVEISSYRTILNCIDLLLWGQ